MQLHVSAPFRFSSIGLRHLQRKIRYRLAIALLGKSASARIKFADFLQESPGYKGPVLKLNNRILVACGDHYLWARNGDSGVGQGLLKHGAWQRDDFETALHLIKNYGHKTGGVFVDVGANIGTQSIYAALSGCFDQVIAIEPEPRNVSLLRENFALNEIAVPVNIIEKAVGDREGSIHLNLHETDSGMHSLTVTPSRCSIEVTIDTLPNILGALSISPEEVGFLWMDIEGHEFDVFKTTDDLFAVQTPLFFEYGRHATGDRRPYWAEKFKAYGYRSWIIRHGRAERVEIDVALDIKFGNILMA